MTSINEKNQRQGVDNENVHSYTIIIGDDETNGGDKTGQNGGAKQKEKRKTLLTKVIADDDDGMKDGKSSPSSSSSEEEEEAHQTDDELLLGGVHPPAEDGGNKSNATTVQQQQAEDDDGRNGLTTIHPPDDGKEEEMMSSATSSAGGRKGPPSSCTTMAKKESPSTICCCSSSSSAVAAAPGRNRSSSSSDEEREKVGGQLASSSSSAEVGREKVEQLSSSSSSSADRANVGGQLDNKMEQKVAASSPPFHMGEEEFERDEKVVPPLSSTAVEEKKKSSAFSSSVEEKKKKDDDDAVLIASSFLLDESSLDPKVCRWLQSLKRRAELETMSVLYAKSVPTLKPTSRPTLAHQRVPLRERPVSTMSSKHDGSDRCSVLAMTHSAAEHWFTTDPGHRSPPKMRRKQQQDQQIKQSDQQRSHHRSTVCLSSSAISPSLVMSRQSIVIVPAGEDGTDGDELSPFSKSGAATHCGTTTTIDDDGGGGGDGGGTLTKFALSLPNDASLGERLLVAHRPAEWTPPTTARKIDNIAADQQHRVVPLLTTMDYAELPLCDPTAGGGSIYQPRIKYRRNRKVGGSSTSVNASGGGGGAHTLPNQRRKSPFSIADSPPLRSGGLAVRPIAFRHSIRVNELDEGNELMNIGNRKFPLPHSMSMSLFCTNKFNGTGVEDESPYEEGGSGSLDSGQCSGSSPPFFNNCASLTAFHRTAPPPPPLSFLLQRHNNNLHHHHHQRRCRCSEDEAATSSEAGTTASSVELTTTTAKFGGGIDRCGGITTKMMMPSYARTANCISQVLRQSSIIFAHLGTASSEHRRFNGTKKLLSNTKAYIRLLSECPCAAQMPQSEMELVRRAMQDAEGELLKYDSVQPNDYLGVCVRRMLEQTLLVFVRLISHYLSECANHDQLLLIALEQFVHLLLFGDELCLEAIRHKAMDNLLALALVPLTGSDTLKLLLRTMSVLCGTAKGCIQLLSIGGLDLVLRVLRDSTHADCSIEAAGCLAQLCSPAHCFLRLSPHSLHPLVPRLLKLVDHSPSPEALLLCLAALANMSAQCAGPVTELLYTHNAILRLVKAAGREHSNGNLFVQEELVTIFTRMANRGFERALVAQGAIPVLCRLLQLEAVESQSQRQSDFQRRVSYKAAVCLGILASTGSGLKALYEHEVHKVLSKIVCPASGTAPSSSLAYGMTSSQSVAATTAPPIQLICSSISQRLQHTYQLETAV